MVSSIIFLDSEGPVLVVFKFLNLLRETLYYVQLSVALGSSHSGSTVSTENTNAAAAAAFDNLARLNVSRF